MGSVAIRMCIGRQWGELMRYTKTVCWIDWSAERLVHGIIISSYTLLTDISATMTTISVIIII